MDLNRLLLWMAGVSCSLNLLYSLRSADESQREWRRILVGLLATLAIGLLAVPQWAGYIVGLGWFVLVLLPALLQHLVNRLLVNRRYAAAMALAKAAARLHLFDAWDDPPEIVRALRWYHEGRTAEAAALINHLGRTDSPIGRLAVLMRAQQTGEWEPFLAWLNSLHSKAAQRDEDVLLGRLQALGELGRRQEMLHAYQQFLNANKDAGDASVGVISLRVAALSGLPRTVGLLTDAMASSLPKDAEQYWRLTARQVAGVSGTAAGFRKLQGFASPYLATMITRRIEHPLSPLAAGELDAAALRTRDQLSASVAHETRYALIGRSSRQRPFATWSIAVVLIGVFIREIPGGSTDPMNQFWLGALMIPTSLTPGQGWRILTAGLLHSGPLHLAMNLLGLLYLGSKLEHAWGPARMTACYFIATVTSMGLAPYLVSVPQHQAYVILVGASGGVMGLLGAIIGHLAGGWWRGRNRRVARQLGLLLLLVSLETVFDLSTPNVSFACHLLGLTTGLMFAVATGLLSRRSPVEA